MLSPRSRPIVYRLSALFAIDSFGSGFIGGNILALYFTERLGLSLSSLGLLFFATQIIAALSFFVGRTRRPKTRPAADDGCQPHTVERLPHRRGLRPTAPIAVVLLLCRQSLSQMDVPTRQSYIMAIVDKEDWTPAVGFTGTTRTVTS